jgi:hypothetical protein
LNAGYAIKLNIIDLFRVNLPALMISSIFVRIEEDTFIELLELEKEKFRRVPSLRLLNVIPSEIIVGLNLVTLELLNVKCPIEESVALTIQLSNMAVEF